ncbi:unnamed protein product [Miscanthus lutarioriparius]|uniref:Uncharacterized protein n=1 Tax=Miscanthus lutarioriparius TaxID=422564 RepID=A0A811S1N8_9POAL|nr:unnamed protein product [Miscanthus lutarioriparius]
MAVRLNPEEKWRAIEPAIGTPGLHRAEQIHNAPGEHTAHPFRDEIARTNPMSSRRGNEKRQGRAGRGAIQRHEQREAGKGILTGEGGTRSRPRGVSAARRRGGEGASRRGRGGDRGGDILDGATPREIGGGQKEGDETRREDMVGEAQVGTGAGLDYRGAPGGRGRITPGAGRVVAGDGASG